MAQVALQVPNIQLQLFGIFLTFLNENLCTFQMLALVTIS